MWQYNPFTNKLDKVNKHNKILTVGEGGDYTKLSDALSSITDASKTNRYCIVVIGKIIDDVQINAKSYVDVVGFSADITVQTDSNVHGVVFDSIVESEWRGITIRRAGNVTSGVRACYIKGTTDKTCRLVNCKFINEISAAVNSCYGIWIKDSASPTIINCEFQGSNNGGNSCYGIEITNSASPTITGCKVQGGSGGDSCYGIWIGDFASPTITGCKVQGGSGGSYCYGILIGNSASPTITGCEIQGGSGGSSCHGIRIEGSASPTITGCKVQGGSGGDSCHGILIGNSASPTITGCKAQGGSGGSYCYGIRIGGSASPTITGCKAQGGSGGNNCHGIWIEGSASPTITGCKSIGGTISSHNTNFSESFQPYSDKPYMLLSIVVKVNIAQESGATLKLGTTEGGDEIASGIPVDSTGWKFFDFNRVERAAGEYLYATVVDSGGNPISVSSDAITIYYSVITNYADCSGLYLNTYGYARIEGGTFIGNGASEGVKIAGAGISAKNWLITNATIETLDPANEYSITADSSLTDAPVYNCVLVGGLLNVTPASGTAQGSNIQV